MALSGDTAKYGSFDTYPTVDALSNYDKICGFCIHYNDLGNGPEERDGFAGYGHCTINNKEVSAWGKCDEYFVCAHCQREILEYWRCI